MGELDILFVPFVCSFFIAFKEGVNMNLKSKGDLVKFIRRIDYIWEKPLDEGGLGKTVLIRDPHYK